MIAFNDGYEPQSSSKMSKSELESLVKALMGADPYYNGSYHGGLSPASLIEIIKYLMFTEDNDSIQVIIDKELDGYHLALTVDKKENK
tara:strand:- start:3424 stop:3687 length:264 start_codon:yes stop_codon:yes gene_type:complete